jgi:hypothetical protein
MNNMGRNVKQEQEDICAVENNRKNERVLYIITDREDTGLVNYFRENGVYVGIMDNRLDMVKNMILIESEDMHIVIIDTGMGRFSAVSDRKIIRDIIGISGENAIIDVYYTDELVKEAVKNNSSVSVSKYTTMTEITANLLNTAKNKKIEYKHIDTKQESKHDASLDIKGIKVIQKPSRVKRSMMSIKDMQDSNDELIENFSIRI